MNQNFNKRNIGNLNINLMKENVIQNTSGIMINVDASVKTYICEKNIFGILLYVIAKIVNI